jgi:glucose-6-phosphate isomerase
VLTLFDYIVEELKDKIDFSKNFLAITEKNTAPLYALADHLGVKIIEHDPEIGGRFSIFSHTGLIPISLFNDDDVENFLEGSKEALDNFINDKYSLDNFSPKNSAAKKFELMQAGKKINIMLFYGDELFELGNWLKQLFAESLGKNGFGYLPIVSKMTQDQHSLLQLYLDGPKDKFFEIYAINHNESDNFIDITLTNHKDAMVKTLEGEKLPIVKICNFIAESDKSMSAQLGNIFANSVLEVLILAELAGVDPFGQDAVEKQKVFLK